MSISKMLLGGLSLIIIVGAAAFTSYKVVHADTLHKQSVSKMCSQIALKDAEDQSSVYFHPSTTADIYNLDYTNCVRTHS